MARPDPRFARVALTCHSVKCMLQKGPRLLSTTILRCSMWHGRKVGFAMSLNRLTPERIIAAATEVIETGGAKLFSMRKLAEKLDVDPMAMYHYFPNKASLLEAVLNQAMARMDLTVKGEDWKQDTTHICQSFRKFALDHPQIFYFYTYSNDRAQVGFDLYEAFYSVFLGIGFSKSQVVKCTRMINIFLEEFCYSEAFGWFERDSEEEFSAALRDKNYPSLWALKKEMVENNFSEDFQFFLDVIFAGIEAHCRN